jgi:hypothetical protein
MSSKVCNSARQGLRCTLARSLPNINICPAPSQVSRRLVTVLVLNVEAYTPPYKVLCTLSQGSMLLVQRATKPELPLLTLRLKHLSSPLPFPLRQDSFSII